MGNLAANLARIKSFLDDLAHGEKALSIEFAIDNLKDDVDNETLFYCLFGEELSDYLELEDDLYLFISENI